MYLSYIQLRKLWWHSTISLQLPKTFHLAVVRILWTCSYIKVSVVDIGKIEKNKLLLQNDQFFSKAGVILAVFEIGSLFWAQKNWCPNFDELEKKTKPRFIASANTFDCCFRTNILSFHSSISNCSPWDFEILGWCPVGPVLPHGEKVPL